MKINETSGQSYQRHLEDRIRSLSVCNDYLRSLLRIHGVKVTDENWSHRLMDGPRMKRARTDYAIPQEIHSND